MKRVTQEEIPAKAKNIKAHLQLAMIDVARTENAQLWNVADEDFYPRHKFMKEGFNEIFDNAKNTLFSK